MALITIATSKIVLHEYGKQRKDDSSLINFFGVALKVSSLNAYYLKLILFKKLFHG